MSAGLTTGPFEGTAGEWDALVGVAPGGTHFHRFGWRNVMREALGHETFYLAAREPSGRLAGVLPLVRVRSVLFGHYLVSVPFVNYGGPLGTDDAVRALCDEAVALARRDKVKLLELRSRAPLPIELDVSHRKITVVLPLAANEEAAWRGLDAKVRSQVRRPQKEGMTSRFGLDQLAPFYDVFRRHMRDLGTPVLGAKVFESMAAAFPESMIAGCVYAGDAPVAGGVGFRWGNEFEITWASSLLEYKRSAPNMLLYWEFMRHVIAAGVTLFNFGRCTPDGGTHKFKRQWGGRDEQLHWYRLAAGADVRTPSPDAPGLAWGPRIWRRLPLGVASTLGPHIVRLIP
jgi:FemAB-related protein (PEP-CTERM system-associated)